MNNPFEDRLLAEGNAELDDLFDTIKALLEASWGDTWGVFTDDEPTGTDPTNVPLPVISFDVLERIVDPEHRAIMPVQTDIFPDPESPGDTITLYRQWFLAIVSFDIWTKTNKEGRVLARKFERFMLTFNGHFRACGIQSIFFSKEESDRVSKEGRQSIPRRTLCYSVRIERITPVRSKKLQEVIEKVNVQ